MHRRRELTGVQLLVEALPPAVWMAVELSVVVAPEERASTTPCGRTGRGGSGADGGGARIRDAVREEGRGGCGAARTAEERAHLRCRAGGGA